MWSDLEDLAAVCTRAEVGTDDIVAACAIIRRALKAEDAYVIRAGDPAFIRIGCSCEPSAYEIKQKGYWLVWRQTASNPQFSAGMFDASAGIVSGGTPLRAGRPTTHVAAILPGDESNSEIVVIRGPWPAGLTGEEVAFINGARPIVAHLVANVLDAGRRARQREQLEALANVSKAFNEAREADDVLDSLATALAKASGIAWVTITTYNDACDAIRERAMNVARHSSTSIARRYGQGRPEGTAAEVRFGIEMAERGTCVLIPDAFDPQLVDRPDVAAIRGTIPALQKYWERAHVLSIAMLPIVFQRTSLGYVAFSSSARRPFDAEEVRFLQSLTSQAATAIRGLHLYQDLQESRDEVRKREEWFRSLVQNSTDLISVLEPDTTVRYQSPSVSWVLGYEQDEILGQKLLDRVHPDDAASFIAMLHELMTQGGGAITGDSRVRHADGGWRHLEFTGTDQRDNPAIHGLVLNLRDVTERKILEEQLRHQALHDPLTHLANRTRFTDRLEHALLRYARTGSKLAVLFMDLDNFKGVNDSLGHSAGDRLLTQVAERVQGCLRRVDTVARLGGDEFAVLLEDVSGIAEATATAGRILETLQESFLLDGKELFVRASIGVGVSDGARHGANAEALLRDADTAMYVAKAHGKGRCEVFEDSMQVAMVQRLALLADLQRALERQEFVLHYQPVVLLENGKLFGVEALVRWQHPDRGLIPPGDFIALAEESGAILALGKWVLDAACRQAVAWQEAFPDMPEWTLSVNVSAKQLQQPGFVGEVSQVLRATGMDPQRLILEITESVIMQDVHLMMARLQDLKELGVRLAIDDFGTGYSSLSYLRQFPFDLLKIDKSFIDDSAVPQQKDLTRAIIELGKTLDLELVAEGIERTEQLSRLKTLECQLGQGFLFAEPLERNAVAELFRELNAAARGEQAA